MKNILNSASTFDTASRLDLLSSINSSLCTSDIASTSISSSVVSKALSHLKSGKSDGTSLLSNHFIYASSVLSEPLSSLFTGMIRHGYVPTSLRDCILQPIPKPSKDPSMSDN